MRIRALVALALTLATVACGGRSLFRQYEYEEDVYLSLDGSADVYVNASVPALNALRGTSFDTSPTAPVDRDAVREYYSTPLTRVAWVRTSRRSNRRFVHVRIEVDDINRIAAAAPFAWSGYRFQRDGDAFVYRQTIGAAAGKPVGHVGWNGRELAAFRLHLPSKITFHNSGSDIRRGNILVWEQPLAARLQSVSLTLEARMEAQSILYRTLWLFGATFIAVAITFIIVLLWVLRRSREPLRGAEAPGSSAGGGASAP